MPAILKLNLSLQVLAEAIELGIPLVKECEVLLEEINKQRE